MMNQRNSQIVGNNSKSYDDKHPTNPIVLRPIRDAIANTPKIADKKGRVHSDYRRINHLRRIGGWMSKPEMLAEIVYVRS